MTKHRFRKLFERALKNAAKLTEARLGQPVPRSFLIELHAPASTGRVMGVDEAFDQLYLGDGRYYRIIDVTIRRLLPDQSVAFVRVSGHGPVSFEDTWDPTDLGP